MAVFQGFVCLKRYENIECNSIVALHYYICRIDFNYGTFDIFVHKVSFCKIMIFTYQMKDYFTKFVVSNSYSHECTGIERYVSDSFQ